jgi:hypothetical protein
MQQRAPRLECSQPSGGMTVASRPTPHIRPRHGGSPGTSAGRQHTVTTRFIYADRPCRLGETGQPRTRTTRVKGDAVNNDVEAGFAVVRLGRRAAAAG